METYKILTGEYDGVAVLILTGALPLVTRCHALRLHKDRAKMTYVNCITLT